MLEVFALVWLFIIFLGAKQMCKWVSGNKAVKGAAKDGLLNLFGRLFK